MCSDSRRAGALDGASCAAARRRGALATSEPVTGLVPSSPPGDRLVGDRPDDRQQQPRPRRRAGARTRCPGRRAAPTRRSSRRRSAPIRWPLSTVWSCGARRVRARNAVSTGGATAVAQPVAVLQVQVAARDDRGRAARRTSTASARAGPWSRARLQQRVEHRAAGDAHVLLQRLGDVVAPRLLGARVLQHRLLGRVRGVGERVLAGGRAAERRRRRRRVRGRATARACRGGGHAASVLSLTLRGLARCGPRSTRAARSRCRCRSPLSVRAKKRSSSAARTRRAPACRAAPWYMKSFLNGTFAGSAS